MEDIIRSLGYLTLGSRLKRIGEQLQADTQRMLDGLEVPVQSSQYPLLAALDRLGPLPVGELAQSLGITQPGVTRSVALLAELGLVEVIQSDGDQRRRMVSLTRNGQCLVDRAKRDVWPRIEPLNFSFSSSRISPGSRQWFVGPASSSRSEQMNVRSSTRATSLGSESARYEFGRLKSLSRSNVPASTIFCAIRSYSSADPSHQCTASGWVSSATSSTHLRSF